LLQQPEIQSHLLKHLSYADFVPQRMSFSILKMQNFARQTHFVLNFCKE